MPPQPQRREQPPAALVYSQVRQRAYELWEQAGRPQGRDKEFWYQACSELEERLLTEPEQRVDTARNTQEFG